MKDKYCIDISYLKDIDHTKGDLAHAINFDYDGLVEEVQKYNRYIDKLFKKQKSVKKSVLVESVLLYMAKHPLCLYTFICSFVTNK